MANQMQPSSGKSAFAAIVWSLIGLATFLIVVLGFCGSTVERAFKQADEIGACRDDTDACNAPPAPVVPDLATLPTNPNGTPYGLCVAGLPDADGNLPPGVDFDASNAAPPQCITIQSPSGGLYPAYVWNQADAAETSGGGRGGWMNWGLFFRALLVMWLVIFGWWFWRKWRRNAHRRKQELTIATQPVDDDGRPKLPTPVRVPGLPDDDDDDPDDEDEDYR
jgi:hypothetical protein